jgi:signal peptidase
MSKKSEALALVQDVVVALIVVAIVLGSLYVYGGRWPPMVVVESESMQHDDELSFMSVIDTGDLTLVRTLENAGAPVTWVEGRETGYERYSEFGDVIIYHKNGQAQTTPIIHRAIVRIEYNPATGGFNVPTLDPPVVDEMIEFTIEDFNSYHNGHRESIDLVVKVETILKNFEAAGLEPHGGIITKGDHNREVDQYSLPAWSGPGPAPEGLSRLVEPVEDGWIVGVARGEIPWFGLIKLWARGQTVNHPAPVNSGPNLIISVALLLVAPFLAESAIIEYRNLHPKEDKEKGRRRRRGGDEEEGRQGPILFLVSTLRNAFTGKVDD